VSENYHEMRGKARAHFRTGAWYYQDTSGQPVKVPSLAELLQDTNKVDLAPRFSQVVTSDEVRDLSSFVRTLADTLGLGAEIRDSWHLPPASLPTEGTGRHVPVNVTAQLLLLVLMWLIVMTVPVAIQESKLTAETQQTLNDYYAILGGFVVSITVLIAPKLMKKNGKK
jgi:hypothetical protein